MESPLVFRQISRGRPKRRLNGFINKFSDSSNYLRIDTEATPFWRVAATSVATISVAGTVT